MPVALPGAAIDFVDPSLVYELHLRGHGSDQACNYVVMHKSPRADTATRHASEEFAE